MQDYTLQPTNEFQFWARADSTEVYNHIAMKHTQRLIERFKVMQKGKTISDVPDAFQVRKRNGKGELSGVRYSSNYRHLKDEMISFTIPASFYSNFIHPFYPRNITAREAARLQSFPDWYEFKGQRTLVSSKLLKRLGKESQDHLSQYNQIGNAVPPLLAMNIAKRIKEFLDKEHFLAADLATEHEQPYLTI